MVFSYQYNLLCNKNYIIRMIRLGCFFGSCQFHKSVFYFTMGEIGFIFSKIRACFSFLRHLDEPALTKNFFARFSFDRTQPIRRILSRFTHFLLLEKARRCITFWTKFINFSHSVMWPSADATS